jgi:hypothetical protein
MTALPPVLEAALAATLLASILRAFFGPPPREADTVAGAGWLLAGIVLLATVLIAGAAADPRDVLTAAAVEALCLAGWWMRRRDAGGEGEPEPGPPPIDWDAFDRVRAGWRPREPV